MTDFQGALGVAQMERLEEIVNRRIVLADLYHGALATAPRLGRPSTIDGVRHIWQSYVVMLDETIDRAAVMAHLQRSRH